MNWRPNAPRASGLVCSGDRLVITTSQRQESPETVEEAPESAEPRLATAEVQEGAEPDWTLSNPVRHFSKSARPSRNKAWSSTINTHLISIASPDHGSF